MGREWSDLLFLGDNRLDVSEYSTSYLAHFYSLFLSCFWLFGQNLYIGKSSWPLSECACWFEPRVRRDKSVSSYFMSFLDWHLEHHSSILPLRHRANNLLFLLSPCYSFSWSAATSWPSFIEYLGKRGGILLSALADCKLLSELVAELPKTDREIMY